MAISGGDLPIIRRAAPPCINSHGFDDVLRCAGRRACYEPGMFTDRPEDFTGVSVFYDDFGD
jgi:hypothetical protein